MLERRKTPRVKACAPATVAFGFGPDIECLVRDRSAEGARLVFAHRVLRLPKEFSLGMLGDTDRRRCRLVWQKGFRAGVRIVTASGS